MKKIILITILVLFTGTLFKGFTQSEEYLNNSIIIEGIYVRNLGNFSEVWSKATGGYIGYSIAFPEHNLLMMRTGFISNSLKDGIDYQDATSTIIPLEIGGRYYFFDSRFMPFLQFMNGINILFENTNLEGENRNNTLVKYAWQIGFGITANISNNLNIDLGVNYQSDFYTTEAMMTGFKYAFGVGLAL